MKFRQEGNEFMLASYSGDAFSVTIPPCHHELPVTRIGPKAFLSCKNIVELTLPDSITEIGDWTFAHMKNLKKLTLPKRQLTFGKSVFLDCGQLSQILITEDNSDNPGTGYLLASAVTLLNNIALCRPDLAGSNTTHKQWLAQYDDALTSFFDAPDISGFDPVFLGWFHVEDLDSQQSRFILQRRKEKTYLCFLRLLYDMGLSNSLRERLQEYLVSHMPKGKCCKEHMVPFSELCQVYQNDIRYLQCIENTGYITSETIDELMDGLQNASLEIKALLLKYQQKFCQKKNFFDELKL